MASNRLQVIGPVALTTTLTTNILNGAVTSLAGPVGITLTQPIIILRHIRIVNKTASAATFSLWLGGTGGNVAGTEFIGTGTPVAANSYFDWYGYAQLVSTQFLVGGSGTATALTLQAEAEVGF
jgi:hypothetical protein